MTFTNQPLRVCYFGTYRQNYARNQIMIEGLRYAGIEVFECHETLWQGTEDRVRVASGGWIHPSFWWRVMRTYILLLWRYCQVKDYDVLIVGYPGQFDVFLGKILSWLRHKPFVWDVLNSMYLIAYERGLVQRHAFTTRIIQVLEGMACHLPDCLILDTKMFMKWFQAMYGIGAEHFRLVPIGADDRVFQEIRQRMKVSSKGEDGVFRVLYYGSYIPNHGVDVIVEAARLLQNDKSILFQLIGDGPEKAITVELAERYGLKNIIFIDWLEKKELVQKIAACNICLGTFGDTLQASLTNNNKIYEGFALGKPVISGESPAIPEVLIHGLHLFLCKRGDPQALRESILTLKSDPGLCKRMGENGFDLYSKQFNIAHIGEVFASILHEIVVS